MSRYIVIRPASDLPDGILPPEWDGRWLDATDWPDVALPDPSPSPGHMTAVATGRYETRVDGAEAEVFEVRPERVA